MRTLTELMDDLTRLDGRRFDETVFEILHRGARSIERLRSFAESAEPALKAKIGQSVARQWTRVQELLVNLGPAPLASQGARWALGLGPAQAIVRRALKAAEQGEYEVAACLAAAIEAGEAGGPGAAAGVGGPDAADPLGYDYADLRARLAMASGRPAQAMEALRTYLVPGPWLARARPLYARAALAAGRFREAYPTFAQAALEGMVLGSQSAAFADCIHRTAVAGRVEGWEEMAEAFCEVVEGLAAQVEEAVRAEADPDMRVADALEAVRLAAADMAQSQAVSPRQARALQGELGALLAEVAAAVKAAAEALKIFDGADAETLAARAGIAIESQGYSAVGPGKWLLAVEGFGAADAGDPGQGLAQLPAGVLLAAALGRLEVCACWADGFQVVSLSLPDAPGTRPSDERSSVEHASREQAPAAPEPREVLRMLRGKAPAVAAETLIREARGYLAAHGAGLVRMATETMKAIEKAAREGDLNGTLTVAASWFGAEISDLSAGAEGEGLDDARGEGGGGCEGAARPDGAHGAAAGAGEPGQDAAREAGTSQSEQAYRTAQMLIAAAADGQLPELQLELIPFLLNKAVTARLEQGTASVLAAHRLRPVLSAMVIESGKRGKRRRELRPDALESTAAAAGGMWDVSRVKVALERLCSVVLDGANRRITADPALAGMAFVCSGMASHDAGQLAAGKALLRFSSALQAAESGEAGRRGEAETFAEMEEAARDAFDALAALDGLPR